MKLVSLSRLKLATCYTLTICFLVVLSYKIHGDFVLISGDTVSNMSLTQALQEHKERKKKDNNAVMTMIIKKSKPSPITRQSRLGTDELFMAIDPNTKQLLYYEDKADYSKGTICLDKMLLAENPSISLHNDKQVHPLPLASNFSIYSSDLLLNIFFQRLMQFLF